MCKGIHIYGSETMIWKEKEKSRIRVVQTDNLRGLLGIKRMDKVPNARKGWKRGVILLFPVFRQFGENGE